jgi:hypothetical protein
MTDNPINPKNEFAPEPSQEKAWYRLSPGAWGFLALLFALNVFNLLIPHFLDPVFRNLDIRLWPNRYFVVLAVALVVSLLWYLGTSRRDEENEKERDNTQGKVIQP